MRDSLAGRYRGPPRPPAFGTRTGVHLDRRERDGEPHPGVEAPAVLDVVVEVWLGGVAGVATAPEPLAPLDALAGLDEETPRPEVSEDAVLAVAVVEDHVVPADVALERVDPAAGLRVVAVAVARLGDDASRGREYRAVPAVVLLGSGAVALVGSGPRRP